MKIKLRLFVKHTCYILLIACCAAATSCKSLQQTLAKDNSRNNNQPSSKTQSGKTEFLDNISVTPGYDQASELKKENFTWKYSDHYSGMYNDFNIEAAIPIQFKFATLTDAPVEDMRNIPLLETLDHWWGTKYCLGGSTEVCIDCSAFTQNVMCHVFHVQIPRTAQQQYDSAVHIQPHELREGDLVFFQTTGRAISHVGVYLTNNKFAHASVSNGVIISDLNETYWKARFRGAGRFPGF